MTNTKDAALSRLFGADTEKGAGAGNESSSGEGVLPERTSSGGASPTAVDSNQRHTNRASQKGPRNRSQKDPGGREEGRSGYIGLGRYAREDGILERITPYVRPDQAEALRVAVARKRDARGRDISQIIQTLLDEAGYRDGSV